MSTTYGKRYEDYIKTIYRIQKEKGEVRLKDVADAMNLKPPTVLQYVNKLERNGLVEYSRGKIRLTEKGIEYAERLQHRYNVIYEFLVKVLKVPPQRAEKEACLAEHVFSEETAKRVEKFLRIILYEEECVKLLSALTSADPS